MSDDSALTRLTSLRLASGDEIEIEGSVADLSVFGAIQATGEWEPDLCAFFAQAVAEDAVIIDVGANIGAHTLSFGKLARRGQVIAFEADPSNFALLAANVARLQPPTASVSCVPLALWDRTSELQLARVEQLAGCSFIAATADDTVIERQIRAVVRNPSMAEWQLDVRHVGVSAVALDDWIAARNFERLDLIKIDIEGAERFALAGAKATLRRFDPVLISEYNPDCAVTYQTDDPAQYFAVLDELFADIRAIGPGGLLSEPIARWEDLHRRLALGSGWLDLCCRSVRH